MKQFKTRVLSAVFQIAIMSFLCFCCLLCSCSGEIVEVPSTVEPKPKETQITSVETSELVLLSAPPVQVPATLSNAAVYIDGNPVTVSAYNIGGSNYFRLRDLAFVLNGTQAQFEVSWNDATKTITLSSGQPYTPVGGELTSAGPTSVLAQGNTSTVVIDGQITTQEAYNINGATYFKLRDIGQLFDFQVGWVNALSRIVIDSNKHYGTGELTLEEEYRQIVDSRTFFDGKNSGLYYADYVDFDNDGVSELLLLTTSGGQNEYDGHEITIEVYGNVSGHASQYGGTTSIMNWGYQRTLSLVEKDGQTFVKVYIEDGHCEYFSYYGAANGSLFLADKLDAFYSNPYGTGYFLPDDVQSAYDIMQASYTNERKLVSPNSSDLQIDKQGILVDFVSPYKAALLNALNTTKNLEYAKLIDFDQNGTEDLLVLRDTSTESYTKKGRFLLYTWDGVSVQTFDLGQSSNEEFNRHLQNGIRCEGIYRNKSTGAYYVRYSGEIVGGWGGTLYMNPSDAVFFGEPNAWEYIPYDEESTPEDDAAWDAVWNEYLEARDREFELVEEVALEQWTEGVGWVDVSYDFTIENVRQQLMER